MTTILKQLAAGLALTSLAAGPAAAAMSSAHSSRSSSETIQLRRANGLIGLDVISSDGRKVGDIVDLAFQLQATPASVTHALIMSGGFFDMGGDVRAVPIGVLTLKPDSARLAASARDFDTAPLIPTDRGSFFADASRVAKVDGHFQAQTSTAKEQADYVLYSNLHRENVVDHQGNKLGYITDVWVSLEDKDALLVEMNPATEISFPFRVRSTLRYELPTSMYRGMAAAGTDYQFAVNESQLTEAPNANFIDKLTLEVGVTERDTVMRLKPAATEISQS